MVIWKQTTLDHLTNSNTGGLLSIWVTRPSLGGKGFFLLKDPVVDSLMKIAHFQLPHILSEPKLVELAAKLKRSPAQVVLRLLFPAVFAYLCICICVFVLFELKLVALAVRLIWSQV